MSSLLRGVATPFRNHLRLATAGAIIVASFVVPMELFGPMCRPGPYADLTEVGGPLASDYRDAFEGRLRYWNIRYWYIGGTFLKPFLPNPFDPRSDDVSDGIWDSSYKTAAILGSEPRVQWMKQEGLMRADYEVPERAKAFADALRGPNRHDVVTSCEFIRAVAIQGPPEVRD